MSGSFCPAVAARVSTFRSVASAVGVLAGGCGQMLVHSERPWSSQSFSGTRHALTWAFDGHEAVEAGELLLSEFTEYEIVISGQQVVETSVTAVEHRSDPPRLVADLELLLVAAQ